jgi:polygalacturonase
MFSGSSDCTIIGMPGHEIHGNGQEYWDGGGGNKGIRKPKFMRIEKVTDSSIVGLYVINTPVHSFAISGSDRVTLDGIRLDNSAGDKPCSALQRSARHADVGGGKACGHNTDGFGVSGSKGIKIINVHVDNQDDCLAVNSGTDIHFMNNYCSGGHGISIGSIKSGAKVSGVHVTNSTIRNSENGVRIKTYNDATDASVSDVHYKDIKLEGITKFGIIIQQDYRNDGPTGTAGNSVPIKSVSIKGVKGTMKSGQGVYINCGRGTCSGWELSDIAVTGGRVVKAAPSGCIQAPASAAPFCKG